MCLTVNQHSIGLPQLQTNKKKKSSPLDLYTITLGRLILSSRSQCAKEKKSHATNTRFLQCHFYLTRVVAADQGFFLFSLLVSYIHRPTIYCSWVVPLWSHELLSLKYVNVISYASLSDILIVILPFLQCHFYLTRVVVADQGLFLFSLFLTYLYRLSFCSWVVPLWIKPRTSFFQMNVISYVSLLDIMIFTVPFLPQ